jgi:hypothetical protein
VISKELVHRGKNELDTSSNWFDFTTPVQQLNRRNSVKQISLLIIAGFIVTGCCSTQTELRSSTSDLQLRRYDLKHCLSANRMSWDKQPVQSNAYNEVTADLEEKAAIEREITRRDITNYHWPPSVTDQYVHDRCHCQCWVVTL